MRKKRLLNRKQLILKVTQAYKNCQITLDRLRTIALMRKEVVATALTLRTALVAEVSYSGTVRFEARPDMLTRMTHCSHAIF